MINTTILINKIGTYSALKDVEEWPILLIRKATRDLEYPDGFPGIFIEKAEPMVFGGIYGDTGHDILSKHQSALQA